ncbi:MAG: hypothetical protein RSA10_02995 [Bacilli bacterium]
MKNILNYYYSLHPDIISKKDDNYSFEYMNSNYVLTPFNRPLADVDCLYKINRIMLSRGLLVHEIILNNDKKILTYVNNVAYILMEIYINPDLQINLSEICHINNNSINIECDKILSRYDWTTLWETKNDYFEEQISEIGKKYPSLCDSLSYYIGLAENAITYVRNTMLVKSMDVYSACHKRIKYTDTLFELYNPINFVLDYRIRDVSEYVKSCFFNKKNAYMVVEEYFQNNYISYKEALLFYGRLLYPSYFFDLYDEIVNNNLSMENINKVIDMSLEYEMFLLNVYLFLVSMYSQYIPPIDWIIKRSYI